MNEIFVIEKLRYFPHFYSDNGLMSKAVEDKCRY